MSEVTPFKPENVADTIRERIQSSFVELIPKEQWDALIKNAIDSFRNRSRDYNGEWKPSPLEEMINTELTRRFRESMLEELNKTQYSSIWQPNGEQVSAMAIEIAKATAAEMQTAFFSRVVQDLIITFKGHLQNEISRLKTY